MTFKAQNVSDVVGSEPIVVLSGAILLLYGPAADGTQTLRLPRDEAEFTSNEAFSLKNRLQTVNCGARTIHVYDRESQEVRSKDASLKLGYDAGVDIAPKMFEEGEIFWATHDDVDRKRAVFGIPIDESVSNAIHACSDAFFTKYFAENPTYAERYVSLYVPTRALYNDLFVGLKKVAEWSTALLMPVDFGRQYYMFEYEDAKVVLQSVTPSSSNSTKTTTSMQVFGIIRVLATLPDPLVNLSDLETDVDSNEAYGLLSRYTAVAVNMNVNRMEDGVPVGVIYFSNMSFDQVDGMITAFDVDTDETVEQQLVEV